MRVFVTGASGFVGSAIVKELLKAGHQVVGLARSNNAAKIVTATGAEVYRGDVDDPESLREAIVACDATIHTAFNHDFSKFKENCESDRRVIQTFASILSGSGKPLVVTSGIGLLRASRPIVESDVPPSSEVIPRAASEEAAKAAAASGIDVYVVRLPPTVHGNGDHGFVPMIINMAKEKGESVYIGEGNNRWPAVHRFDAAALYRLIIEQRPTQKVFHAVAENGIPFRQIAEAIGKGLVLPVVSKNVEDAQKHFTWFTHFAMMDCTASSEETKRTLGWKTSQINLIDDLTSGGYFN